MDHFLFYALPNPNTDWYHFMHFLENDVRPTRASTRVSSLNAFKKEQKEFHDAQIFLLHSSKRLPRIALNLIGFYMMSELNMPRFKRIQNDDKKKPFPPIWLDWNLRFSPIIGSPFWGENDIAHAELFKAPLREISHICDIICEKGGVVLWINTSLSPFSNYFDPSDNNNNTWKKYKIPNIQALMAILENHIYRHYRGMMAFHHTRHLIPEFLNEVRKGYYEICELLGVVSLISFSPNPSEESFVFDSDNEDN